MQAKADYEGKPLITKDERCEIDLGLLEKFDAFARENGLTYWLFWGTLLGAVRHKGFIPWDDDIDIAMPQHDYLRLVELLRQNPTAIRDAYLNAFEIDRGYARPFAKLCDSRTILFEDFDLSYVDEGVCLDIFPLVPASDDEAARGRMCKRWRKDFVLLGLSKGRLVRAKNPLVTVGKVVLKPYATLRGYETFVSDVCDDLDTVRFGFGETRFVACVEESVSLFESAWFEEKAYLPFEHLSLPVPAEWDQVLKKLYGDYRQLPPEEDRRCHQSLAYWKAK